MNKDESKLIEGISSAFDRDVSIETVNENFARFEESLNDEVSKEIFTTLKGKILYTRSLIEVCHTNPGIPAPAWKVITGYLLFPTRRSIDRHMSMALAIVKFSKKSPDALQVDSLKKLAETITVDLEKAKKYFDEAIDSIKAYKVDC